MRKAFCLIAASVALLVPASTALAQGYPSADAATAFALGPAAHPVHYLCGKSLWWTCAGWSVTGTCQFERGLHSRDCPNIFWQEDSVVAPFGYRGCSVHGWVRLESDWSYTWHVDSDSCYAV